jgi:hypothetical protein
MSPDRVTLEQELRELSAALAWPDAPDVAAVVRSRIEAAPRRARRRPRRHQLAIALAVLVAVVAATLAVPQARSAILRALGIGNVRIELVDDLPPTAPRSDLSLLGIPVSLGEAREAFPYELVSPDPELGAPDEIRLGVVPARVSYVWLGDDDVRLLVSQLAGTYGGAKYVKVAGGATALEELTIDGHRALWIFGEAHGFGLIGPTDVDFEEIRLSGNTLLVEDGETTLRIEGDFDRDRAVDIARTLL